MKKKVLVYGIFSILFLLLATGGFYGYSYVSTPAHIRNPAFEHYHIRTQIVVDSRAVDFSTDEFQKEYDASTCSTGLTGQPIDFHDNVDQMTHIHWNGITGGEFLKYYGWNFIGGKSDSLGRRFDQGFMRMHDVQRYGSLLPDIPEKANFYIYTGDENGYKQKDWNNFLNQDLELFFNKKSNVNQDEQASGINLTDWLFPKAYAHGDVIDEHKESDDKELSNEELSRINNLIGNVVIFVQQDQPTDEQVQARFDNLVPLHSSTCGG